MVYGQKNDGARCGGDKKARTRLDRARAFT
ncbi:hypothetical protein J2X98_002635 [Pseudarthrobacter enclensis]|uniref:Uncharacterized protein n=1 Tax=Pseudarthrobacter enclensis TaxID=993070 RepID=A0ABT9RUX5_9MICC|nr:hypothetical protein [Pseudarthrobacter enclensis]